MDWFTKYKKILLVTAFILVVFIVGYLLYVLFFKPSQPEAPITTEQPTATTTQGGLPVAGQGAKPITQPNQGGKLTPEIGETILPSQVAQGGITQTTELNQSPSLSATLASDGSNLLYYDQKDGKFYRISKDGQTTLLTDNVFHEVKKITWSPDKNKAILEYPDQAKIIYDFINNKQISLPKHWKDFDFSPDGSKIVMKSMAESADNRWLAVINDQGTNAQRIAALGDKDATVYPSWSPNNQTVAMYTEGINYDQQSVFFVGLNNENFKSLTIEGRGFEPKWSPQGDRLLYSVYSNSSDLKPELWIASAQGETIGAGRAKLNIQTWANKCTFASKTEIYCAVPEELPEGAGLFPDLAKDYKDNLYKIDTQTGFKQLVAIPDGQYNISDIIISTNGYYLYFTDANTGRINKIKLK
jgi:WD40 repeat protein